MICFIQLVFDFVMFDVFFGQDSTPFKIRSNVVFGLLKDEFNNQSKIFDHLLQARGISSLKL